MAKLAVALVLADVASHGLKPGHLLEGSADLVASLAKEGRVDPHKDAVAHARAEGYPVLRSSVELTAPQA